MPDAPGVIVTPGDGPPNPKTRPSTVPASLAGVWADDFPLVSVGVVGDDDEEVHPGVLAATVSATEHKPTRSGRFDTAPGCHAGPPRRVGLYPVTAPWLAEPTSFAYLPSTPVG